MSVDLGSSRRGVAKQLLNIAQVDALFQEMRGKGMPEPVYRYLFLNIGSSEGHLKNLFHRSNMHWPFFDALKKPSARAVSFYVLNGKLSCRAGK